MARQKLETEGTGVKTELADSQYSVWDSPAGCQYSFVHYKAELKARRTARSSM